MLNKKKQNNNKCSISTHAFNERISEDDGLKETFLSENCDVMCMDSDKNTDESSTLEEGEIIESQISDVEDGEIVSSDKKRQKYIEKKSKEDNLLVPTTIQNCLQYSFEEGEILSDSSLVSLDFNHKDHGSLPKNNLILQTLVTQESINSLIQSQKYKSNLELTEPIEVSPELFNCPDDTEIIDISEDLDDITPVAKKIKLLNQNFTYNLESQPPPPPSVLLKRVFFQPVHVPLLVKDVGKILTSSQSCQIFGSRTKYMCFYGKITSGRIINDDKLSKMYKFDDGTGQIEVFYTHYTQKLKENLESLKFSLSNENVLNSPKSKTLNRFNSNVQKHLQRKSKYANVRDSALLIGKPIKRSNGTMFINAIELNICNKSVIVELSFKHQLSLFYENIFKFDC